MVDINHVPIIFPENPADSTQTPRKAPLQALALGALQAKTAAELRALEVAQQQRRKTVGKCGKVMEKSGGYGKLICKHPGKDSGSSL